MEKTVMNLTYKPDFEQTRQNYLAWWEHEYFGRCALAVKAPRNLKDPWPGPPLPRRTEDRWLDFQYLTAVNEHRMRSTYYGGEALPVWNPGYPGCDSLAAYLGAKVTLGEDTGWKEPVIGDGELTGHDYRDMSIDRDGRWWNFGRDIRLLAVRESLGRSIPGNMAFGGCGDTLAALRGTDRLLYDIMDCPEYVGAFDRHLMGLWMEVYEHSYGITSEAAGGSTCWFELWSPGKFYASQCDFAYMISPKSFIDVFLPSIEMQTRYLDHTVHHVDGIGNFAHVDALLELPRLQALQILPGAGKPSPLHYMDTLKKVQAARRNLHISLPPEQVESALDALSARGLFISTRCATEDEAKALLTCAEKWSVDRG